MVTELLVYADESGTHNGAVYCLVSGFIGSPRQWKKLDKEWGSVLRDFGISSFHSIDFFGRRNKRGSARNPYRNWPDDKAMKFVNGLTDTIKQRQLYPIGCAIDVGAFKSFTKGERRYLTNAAITKEGQFLTSGAPNRPYQYAFGLLIGEALFRAVDDTLIHFVLDINSREQSYALETYNFVKARGTHPAFKRLGQISYADDETEIGLQAADLHAFSWYGALTNGIRRNDARFHVMNTLAKKRNSIEIIDFVAMENRLRNELSIEQRTRIQAL